MVGGGVRIADAVDDLWAVARQLKMPAYRRGTHSYRQVGFRLYGGRIGTMAVRDALGIQNSDLAAGGRVPFPGASWRNIHSFARGAQEYVVDGRRSAAAAKLQQFLRRERAV